MKEVSEGVVVGEYGLREFGTVMLVASCQVGSRRQEQDACDRESVQIAQNTMGPP